MAWDGFEDIAPEGEGFRKESFASWYPRAQARLPNVPACVAENWIHRHWDHSPFEWLPLDRLRFRSEQWSIADVLRIEAGPNWRALGGWVGLTDHHQQLHASSWVWRDMQTRGTWPVPVIVLDNKDGLPNPFGHPLPRWLLLEGHVRSETMRCLIAEQKALPTHIVWVASLEP